MRFALVDSGLGVLPAAMQLRRLCPGAELILSMDPHGMPWGPRHPDDIAQRALACAQATLPWKPDVLVLACNTASVRALDVLRSALEPALPVVGTVPAIKPAAGGGHPVAIWATAATTASPYQRQLIRQFADGVPVTEVACPGLADAIEKADEDAIAAAVAAAASATPSDVRAVVLGCTQYELAMDRIRGVLPRVRLHGSAAAVAAQAMRKLAARPGPRADSPAAGQPVGAASGADSATPVGVAPTGAAIGADGQSRRADRAVPPAPARPGDSRPGDSRPGGTRPGDTGPGDAGRQAGHAGTGADPDPSGGLVPDGLAGTPAGPAGLHVLLSGALGALPEAAACYAEGRLLLGRLRLPSPAA